MQLDAKRQKLKEKLEERERAARDSELATRQRSDEEKFEKIIERLQREGKKQLEEEEERIRLLVEEERLRNFAAENAAADSGPAKIKVRWSGGDYDKVFLFYFAFGCFVLEKVSFFSFFRGVSGVPFLRFRCIFIA